ncbi:dihydroxyacetone kinase subunit DhaL [Rhodospirillum rubrum]|uniref:Dak phosphatase n=1 Tax=Rhodospirillum rubrum (strain ATCC 11170 / ATH 1.1.1 / DSM 467 / LMG 4362 / NCIMB 8255 / S1) TaxID=269796 RepID=Q2RUN4_RHORT|nr:dihydroxyacetone kinase subunit DhaL [Rhodospirillum rubrum]ABC22161.1 Dak phosphatase [Rhodospirillum rubrum ATCC 11170]AEO47875.1 Dak phosphatase [Rhodospirillum rubrum F11]MBK5953749.1 dihydroxyacetone kinase subunit L [Rhodospirillum rubrum]QXG81809.1 dihydroxyacetone kinase subunit L [Rhodospirillum rubrum]HAP98961.1 dihydroxyacetone kinase subunit L [Rhodospirillum rubrum]
MHDTLSASDLRQMFLGVCDTMLANIDRLTKADQLIGDGDHGIGMRRGFTAVRAYLETATEETVGAVFKGVGTALMSHTGGAAGAIFGTLFRAGATLDTPTLTGEGYARFLEDALAAVQKRGGCTTGGKTLIDALAPAALAARAGVSAGAPLPEVLAAAAEAAEQGMEATKAMIATTGKARTLGERSLGHPDPGAISLAIVLAAMSSHVPAPAGAA